MALRNLPSFRGYLRQVFAALREVPEPDYPTADVGSAVTFSGEYSAWEAAAAECGGYDAAGIFEQTKAAGLAVRDGRAAFERDSVLFAKLEYRWEALTAILWQAARDHGDLGVLDFGGSLGSVYFQSRAYLEGLPSVRWGVVEQAHYVEFGNRELAGDSLGFFTEAGECVKAIRPNVAFFGAVLQYLPLPYEVLGSILSLNIPSIVFDRLAVLDGESDRLTIQRVPAEIYSASYPAWFFSESRIRNFMAAAGYRVHAECRNPDHYPLDGATTAFKGYHFIRKK